MAHVLRRDVREDRRRRPCEDGGRDLNDVATSQGTPGATGSWKKRGRILPTSLQRERGPALERLASRMVRESISIVLSRPVCDDCSWQA